MSPAASIDTVTPVELGPPVSTPPVPAPPVVDGPEGELLHVIANAHRTSVAAK
jgi:hypothetical protein